TTDAMNMAAVRDRYGPRDRAVLPLLAGADVILNETSPRRAIGFVVDAVQSGRLSEERINASARRVLRGKARIGLHTASAPERSRLRRMLTEVRGAPLADALTQSAVTVVRGGLIPVTGQRVALVQLANFDAGRAMTRMERDLRADRQVRITRRGGNRGDAVAAARDADVVVLAMHLDVMKRAAPEPTRQQRDVIAAISSTGTPVVAVTIGNPYAASHVADAEGLVMAYDGTVRTATAVADVLRGRREATGRLPVSVPGL
ncbi:MAG: glycoside hydrolase family 3 C-terminal domain-containing protein, partial [Bacteroidota bacterium]